MLEVRSRRVGGATYQVPVEVPARRGRTLAVRWLVQFARARREYSMAERLASEILDATQQQGSAWKRKDDIYRMAQANKAFARTAGSRTTLVLHLVDAMSKPILAVDIDGVISLFRIRSAAAGRRRPNSNWSTAWCTASHCWLATGWMRLAEHYDLVWASGWEDRANDYLPNILGLPQLPHLTLNGAASFGSAHWKLGPLDEFCEGRALAWIDDNFDESCYEWARARRGADPAGPDRAAPRPRGGAGRGA